MNVAIIGAGIVGLSHAWLAAERGHRVTVFERSPRAQGASVRNFGMVWPIGQPPGDCHDIALQSRQRWLKLAQVSNIWVNACGSIHLAHREDEFAVLDEFHQLAPNLGYDTVLLSPSQVIARSPAANPDRLMGGLHSTTELCVNPLDTIRTLPSWLAREFNVDFEFNTLISHAETGHIRSSDGRRWNSDRIIVCGGADVVTLFPDLLSGSGMKVCKLQMLKTGVQPVNWWLGPHLASGLTLRHYHNFQVCPSLRMLKSRIARETPELDRFGIHVMASQDDKGHVILGDSHEYDSEIEPFDKCLIDELILRELQSIIRLPNWTISDRWHGIYAKYEEGPIFQAEPQSEVFVRTGTGGSGMTMSFGLAERDWRIWA